MKRRILSLN